MSKVKFQSVEQYISFQPGSVAGRLAVVRSTVRKALPNAEEVIVYNMPAYKLDGQIILYFAGWKQHYSLYPAGPHLAAAFQDELVSFKVDKGTIRFPLSGPVPRKLIAKIAKFRLAEVAERR